MPPLWNSFTNPAPVRAGEVRGSGFGVIASVEALDKKRSDIVAVCLGDLAVTLAVMGRCGVFGPRQMVGDHIAKALERYVLDLFEGAAIHVSLRWFV